MLTQLLCQEQSQTKLYNREPTWRVIGIQTTNYVSQGNRIIGENLVSSCQSSAPHSSPVGGNNAPYDELNKKKKILSQTVLSTHKRLSSLFLFWVVSWYWILPIWWHWHPDSDSWKNVAIFFWKTKAKTKTCSKRVNVATGSEQIKRSELKNQ